MAEQKTNKEFCIALLREKQASLTAQGLVRFVQRGDFDIDQVVAIKAHLGPWPRALEAAGIKSPRPEDHLQRAREKHIRAKRERTKLLKKQKTAHRSSSKAALSAPDELAEPVKKLGK